MVQTGAKTIVMTAMDTMPWAATIRHQGKTTRMVLISLTEVGLHSRKIECQCLVSRVLIELHRVKDLRMVVRRLICSKIFNSNLITIRLLLVHHPTTGPKINNNLIKTKILKEIFLINQEVITTIARLELQLTKTIKEVCKLVINHKNLKIKVQILTMTLFIKE